jgi:hypothetical protein
LVAHMLQSSVYKMNSLRRHLPDPCSSTVPSCAMDFPSSASSYSLLKAVETVTLPTCNHINNNNTRN